MMISESDLKSELIENCKIFHFGSLSMTHEICRQATHTAIDMAKKAGALISYDPNLREPLWNSLDEAKVQIAYGMEHCDIMKISDNEIQWFTGKEDYDEGIQVLQDTYHIPMILLSLGKDGSRAYVNGLRVEVPAFVQEKTIETTGAGDTFCASILNYVLEHGLEGLTDEQLLEMITFANAGASLITTRKGALRVMPEKQEVLDFIASRK